MEVTVPKVIEEVTKALQLFLLVIVTSPSDAYVS